jgi:hypothetical protein
MLFYELLIHAQLYTLDDVNASAAVSSTKPDMGENAKVDL